MMDLSAPEIIIIFVQVVLTAFWFWMLLAFLRDPRFAGKTNNTRILWLICFVLFGAVTAAAYFFMYYTRDTDV